MSDIKKTIKITIDASGVKDDIKKIKDQISGIATTEASVAKAKKTTSDKISKDLERQIKMEQKAQAERLKSIQAEQRAIQRMGQIEIQAYKEKIKREQDLAKLRASQGRERTIASGSATIGAIIPKAQQDMLKYGVAANKAELAQQKLVRSTQRLNADFRAGKISTEQYQKTLDGLIKKFNETDTSVKSTKNALLDMAKIAAGAFGARELINTVDTFAEFNNRIRTATDSQKEFEIAQQGIIDVAKRTRTDLESNGLLYLRLSTAVDKSVVSQQQMLRITETVNKAVQLGGSSAQEATGALRQFTQILSSGFVTGFSQELNSIMEQTPGLFKVMTDGLRDTSQEFRDLEASGMSAVKIMKTFSEEGIGDLDMLLNALASQANNVDNAFANIAPTIAKASMTFRTALTEYVGQIDQANGYSASLAKTIESLAHNMDLVGATAVTLGGLMAGSLASSLFIYTKGMIAARLATMGLMAALSPIGFAVAAAGVALTLFVKLKKESDDSTESFDALADAINKARSNMDELAGSELSGALATLNAELDTLESRANELEGKSLEIMSAENLKKTSEEIAKIDKEIQEVAGNKLLGILGQRDAMLDALWKKRQEILNEQISLEQEIAYELEQIEERKIKASEAAAKLAAEIKERELAERAAAAAKWIVDYNDELFEVRKINAKFDKEIETVLKRQTEAAGAQAEEFAAALAEIERQRKEALDRLNKPSRDDESRQRRIDELRDVLLSEEELIRKRYQSEMDFADEAIENEVERARIKGHLLGKMMSEIYDLTRAEEEARESNYRSLIESFRDEEAIEKERYESQKALIDEMAETDAEATFLKDQLYQQHIERMNALDEARTAKVKEEAQKQRDEQLQLINAIGNAYQGITDLFQAKTDIRLAAAEKELTENKSMSEEDRKEKEKQAKALFESNKKMTLASIAMQTSLAVINALSDVGVPFWVRAANAVGAAATGAAQFAKASSQTYEAPTPPSASVNAPTSSSVSTQNTQTTINVQAGNASASQIAQELSRYLNDNDYVMFNADSAQGRALNV